MKRFIDLGTQLYLTNDSEDREFAFYCTVKDKFETFSGISTWASVKEFSNDYDGDDIERYLNLIPENWGRVRNGVRFTANLPTREIELNGFQPVRGLREGDKRVLTFDIDINKTFNYQDLIKLIQYLQEQLLLSMEIPRK